MSLWVDSGEQLVMSTGMVSPRLVRVRPSSQRNEPEIDLVNSKSLYRVVKFSAYANVDVADFRFGCLAETPLFEDFLELFGRREEAPNGF